MKPFNAHDNYLKTVAELKTKPSLLLHVCCGICAMYPLLELSKYFKLTLFFSNSNIFPVKEYRLRLNALKEYLDLKGYEIELVVDDYAYNTFKRDLSKYPLEKEQGKRCAICYHKRLARTFQYGVINHFDYLTTTLTVSRFKDSNLVNQIARDLQNKTPAIKYLFSDFKKGGGFETANALRKEVAIYSQTYCGCEYSLKKHL
ncbi:MAG: epoxyqueuosine reductase QueH [Erysipelotrichaceae bacterium]|jgi:predicted adenine nucleotide alpha hydrolase (AANH) superfamily ATPase|nr:epoxyqueuosine reductase QueH [Erysipelotrichaceae bacterium]